MQKKSEVLNFSRTYKDSENNPFNSTLALQNPDLMVNQHDIVDIEDDDI